MNNKPNELPKPPPNFSFTPVPVRYRHDGWTPPRQIAFIEALAETACVEEACRRVGMSVQSARALRRRDGASLFRDAWDAALGYSYHLLEESVLRRSIEGVRRPIFYHGEQVGEWRHYDERLAMWLLRYRRPAHYGPARDQAPPTPPDPDEEVDRLNWLMRELEEWKDEGPEPPEKNSPQGGDA